jgi:hypothetical protein
MLRALALIFSWSLYLVGLVFLGIGMLALYLAQSLVHNSDDDPLARQRTPMSPLERLPNLAGQVTTPSRGAAALDL